MRGLKSIITCSIIFTLLLYGTAIASGPFGTPQPVPKESGGYYIGAGYWYHQDKYKDGNNYDTKQNQAYLQVGTGAKNWELYARIGASDLTVKDLFQSDVATVTTSKNDFESNWKPYGTLGLKGYYPIDNVWGIGAFLQGSYFFADLEDTATATVSGVPVSVGAKISNLWDLNFGIGLQYTVPNGIKLYIGPYVYESEGKATATANVAGINLSTNEVTYKNETFFGGFAGIDFPITKQLRATVECQYSSMFSAGIAFNWLF